MACTVNCVYNSCGCNKNPHTLDWGSNDHNLICYGACNVVHIYKYENDLGGSHVQTLVGHTQLVTSVHWIKENALISTSADRTAIIWIKTNNEFREFDTLLGHTNVVRNASGIFLPPIEDNKLLVATLSTDSTLKLWLCVEEDTMDCIQTISFRTGFGLDVKFAFLNESELVMLVAGDDAKIRIYSCNKVRQFSQVLSLDGHENWIQCLDIIQKGDGSLLLASGSQDHHIRIWKISPQEAAVSIKKKYNLKIDELTFNTSEGSEYTVVLESVLSGHENWIYSVRWHLQSNDNATSLKLLSTSMDKTMIIWEADSDSCIWTEKIRVGEVGGNTLGFYGGVFSPCGKTIVAHGYQGAIHIWNLDEAVGDWKPGLTFGGHYAPVMDIDWEPEGEYLISCSCDETTRIHAPYVASNKQDRWFEIARPQVHGYEMQCVTILNRFEFVSAGEEKILRIFQAPRSFAENLKNISELDTSSYMKHDLAEGASVPSLGLSNKAVFESDLQQNNSEESNAEKHPKNQYPDVYYTPHQLKTPPTEETLIQNTLWPELQKLYGHPYEIHTVTSNHSKTLVASACTASKPEHAAIILWDTSIWRSAGQLSCHNLTVTQMEFSPDDEFLLSVSRDRTWVVYQHFPKESPPYKQIASLDKKNSVHTRIIWSCSWSFDSSYFATSSRDKKVAIWKKSISESGVQFPLCLRPLEVDHSATAVSFAPCFSIREKYIIAVGLENGSIILTLWCKIGGFTVLQELDQIIAHHLFVNRLKFSPTIGAAGNKSRTPDIVQLASCSTDSHIKIYNIIISCLK